MENQTQTQQLSSTRPTDVPLQHTGVGLTMGRLLLPCAGSCAEETMFYALVISDKLKI